MLRRLFLILASTAILNTQSIHGMSILKRIASSISSGVSKIDARVFPKPTPIASLDFLIGLAKLEAVGLGCCGTAILGLTHTVHMSNYLLMKYRQYKLNALVQQHQKLNDPATLQQAIAQRKIAFANTMKNNFDQKVPDLLAIMNNYQDHAAEARPKIQAAIAMNQVKQNDLRSNIDYYELHGPIGFRDVRNYFFKLFGGVTVGFFALAGALATVKNFINYRQRIQ